MSQEGLRAVPDSAKPLFIQSLGGFQVLSDDLTPLLVGERMKKPLELLQALIAAGPRGLTHNTICELLWPDSLDEAAYRTLVTTVFRLRRWLICPEAIWFVGGRVALNQAYCSVDAWEFERAIQAASSIEQRRSALSGYTGPLLRDSDLPLAQAARERLHRHFVDGILQLGAEREGMGADGEAIALYERAIATDGASMELHRALIRALASQGRALAARDAYLRCRLVLRQRFGRVIWNASHKSTQPQPENWTQSLLRHADAVAEAGIVSAIG
jgi:DNA-binding SARP family transcriptional activator